jgi:hypothetical protein
VTNCSESTTPARAATNSVTEKVHQPGGSINAAEKAESDKMHLSKVRVMVSVRALDSKDRPGPGVPVLQVHVAANLELVSDYRPRRRASVSSESGLGPAPRRLSQSETTRTRVFAVGSDRLGVSQMPRRSPGPAGGTGGGRRREAAAAGVAGATLDGP